MEHGTKSGYNKGGCRCNECRAAVAAWKRERRASAKKEKAPKPPGVVVDFSARNAPGRKIRDGEVGERKVSNIGGSPALAAVVLSVLGSKPGDTVEITYGADEIVIRRAGEEKREVVRDYDPGVVKGDDSMSQPGHPLHTTRGRNACRFSDGWSAFDGGFYPKGIPRRALTEAQAIAWCLDGVLPTDGGEG